MASSWIEKPCPSPRSFSPTTLVNSFASKCCTLRASDFCEMPCAALESVPTRTVDTAPLASPHMLCFCSPERVGVLLLPVTYPLCAPQQEASSCCPPLAPTLSPAAVANYVGLSLGCRLHHLQLCWLFLICRQHVGVLSAPRIVISHDVPRQVLLLLSWHSSPHICCL